MLKSSTVKFAQAGQHGLAVGARPTTPGPAQTMMDDGIGGAFDRPAAYRITLGAEIIMTHAVLIRAK
jgi:hypothetical protein